MRRFENIYILDRDYRKVKNLIEKSRENRYSFVNLNNFADLIDIFNKGKFKNSLFFIDKNMLNGDGFKILLDYSKKIETGHIIITSSKNSLQMEKNIRCLNILYYAIKPFRKNEVFDILKSVENEKQF